MADEKALAPRLPKWPPSWNPFEVFLLSLSLTSSVGLIQGNTGSTILDGQLNSLVVSLWGAALAGGSALALAGVYCYRREATLMPGLVLERAGLSLVGVAASIYSAVVLFSIPFAGARWAVSIQIAYASACFFRAWQDHRAIGRTYRVIRRGRTDGR